MSNVPNGSSQRAVGLERKCCFIFGVGILAVVAGSFYWYGRHSEKMILDQNGATCRAMVHSIVLQHHWLKLEPDYEFQKVIRSMSGDLASVEPQFAKWKFIKPLDVNDSEHPPQGDFEYDALEAFQKREGGDERSRVIPGASSYQYVAAVRLSDNCVSCHVTNQTAGGPANAASDVFRAISITLPLDHANKAMQHNRMRLITMAVLTAAFGMALSYVSVHYIVVRPMKV